MSHFYSEVESKNTTHSKCGTKSGMSAHLRGWNVGVRIELRHNPENNKDYITIHRTGGSNNGYAQEEIARISD